MSRLVVLALLALFAAPSRGAELVVWLPYATAARQSKAQQLPLLLYFTDPHCGPCRALEAQVFANPKAAATVNSGYRPVRVVINGPAPVPAETPRLVKKYGVPGAPTVIIVAPTGSELRRFAWLGSQEVTGILNRLAGVLSAGPGAP